MSRVDDFTRLRGEITTLREEHTAFASQLPVVVAKRKRNAGKMLAGFRNDHAAKAKEQRETLDANEAARLEETRAATAVREKDVEQRKDGVAEMLTDFREEHAAKAGEQRETLDANEAARLEKARNAAGEREEFATDLKGNVSEMLTGFREENEAAHRAWHGDGALTVKTKAKPMPEARVKPKAEPKEEEAPDDLTVIDGIGLATERRINAAGINTYAQFAEHTEETLTNLLGRLPRGADVEAWIEEAAELAQQDY